MGQLCPGSHLAGAQGSYSVYEQSTWSSVCDQGEVPRTESGRTTARDFSLSPAGGLDINYLERETGVHLLSDARFIVIHLNMRLALGQEQCPYYLI